MEALIKVQQDLYLRIDKAKSNFKKSPKERLNSADYLKTRIENLESLWNQFMTTHTQIIKESSTLEFTEYITEDIYSNAEELFTDYKSDLKAALSKLNIYVPAKSTEPTTVENKSDVGQGKSVMVKLPKISIPTFSGNYSEWTSFRDLFTSLIHKNRDLDDVQKLHYLKGYLVGEAEQLLRHVQITQDNYSACWEKLEKRYNNKKYLSNCILKRFMSQKNIMTESANALKELLDTTNECLNGLSNLGIDTTTWDIIVIHIICLKLDNESRKQWELKVSESSDDLPTLNQLREFLETRFRALECLDGKSSKTSFIPKKPNAPCITLRCLIDQCSEASFITESAAQLLGLNKVYHKSTVTGLGGEESSPVNSKSVVKVKISSLLEPDFEVNVHAHVLGKVTSNRPRKFIDIDSWSDLSKLDLADYTFNIPGKIDLLLGGEVYGQILLNEMIKAPQGALIAQRTSLGWIVSGPTHLGESEIRTSVSVNHIHLDENELLKKFWELEADHNTTDPKRYYNEDEKKCEEFFNATTERDSTGRYIVKLPFRDQDPSCKRGNFVPIATRRLNQLEKRFAKDAEMKKRYSDVINEYLELEHMEEVPPEQENNPDAVYLPHHAVIRDDRSTSKLRVVFDASCPGSNGVSLNQDLLIKHLRLLRVTFGTASAPHLAVRALQQVAHDEGAQYPNAADRVLNHFYVDDLLTGCESVDEGKVVYQEMNELLQKGGFELQKWSSNSEELMRHMKESDVKEEGSLQLKIDAVMKILGLVWNRRNDEFKYSVQLPPLKVPVTKRSVISDISRLFDPLGWLAPVIIVAKIFIQKLWLSGIEWDDEVPPQLLKNWLSYRESLNQLTKFKLPRWNHASSHVTAELQGFCDASNEAFAAVVYLRTIDEEGNVDVSLITSKTKVAPIKQISIPRLELCGAVLLTKLLMEVADVMSINKANIHAWTDSTVVISWLNSRPNRWKTFVANRVSEIITSVEPHQWSHVSSKNNPADCASRGTQQLSKEELWLEGPSWLKNKEISYKKPNIKDTNLEERNTKECFVNTHDSNNVTADAEETLISKFSKLWKLLRVLAFCKRIFKYAKKEKVSLWLTSSEIQETLKTCIKIVQANHFKEELKNLKENKMINKKSQLTSLNPIVDEDGVLRVGGRLQQAGITEQMKHPVIIPHKSHFTTLILDNAHEKTLHGNPQLMLNYLRSKYFVIGATNSVKLFVRKCVTCARYAAAMRHPLMGQLPSVRGTVNRPFFQSGVDYAGPINMRTSKGRGHRSYKGYICLFICMATRAIHLEAVSDLTAQGFIAAFKRFTARRGHCADLWSDNGTNFVGAARELKQLYAEEKSSVAVEIADQLASNSTNWHWIPPHSPNFGGLWEAGVKSTKHHLRRVIGNSTLTFEEMSTVLAQIEACLNSRPMSRINSSNSDDPIPLTPGHFLVGEPLILVPDSNYEISCLMVGGNKDTCVIIVLGGRNV
ncbi:uncharacterized protein LOC125240435 [Leguminivora glycinivorella]|uniref:uncharacterized protein LOC125240435 n=1 Tax=Leguminivora glycinivorella TaxID=1035111 RepID=UPI00200BAC64|nr:uncharacterized protein LOC125240435 [Leguminivora glycinivorella]